MNDIKQSYKQSAIILLTAIAVLAIFVGKTAHGSDGSQLTLLCSLLFSLFYAAVGLYFRDGNANYVLLMTFSSILFDAIIGGTVWLHPHHSFWYMLGWTDVFITFLAVFLWKNYQSG